MEYLPLGTVLRLKDAEKNIMVIGYRPYDFHDLNDSGDYSAVPYPEGLLSSEKIIIFRDDEIDQIYEYGSLDPESCEFLHQLKTETELELDFI